MRTLFSLVFLTVLAVLPTLAQRGWEVGAAVGGSHYFGDLNKDFNLGDPGPAALAVARYNFSNRWSARLGLGYARVSGSDEDSPNVFERTRNLSFNSNVFDGALGLEFNFMPYDHGSRDNFFTPYVFAGVGISKFEPKTVLDGTTYSLRDFGTEGQQVGQEYYTTSLGINYGLGLKVDLTYEWSLQFEINARQLFTDYLDDVSTVYPDARDLLATRGEIATQLSDRSIELDNGNQVAIGEPGRLRGDATNNDQYGSLTVGLFYYFGQLRCPSANGSR